MNPVIVTEHAKVFHGSNLDVLPHLPDNSVDAIVTDPPYELGFMGKKWDNSGIAYSVELWTECLRVLKPGGHLLAFSGSRTYHRMVVAIEDAGFEIRDMVSWISNKTFPKSQNISIALDKAAKAMTHRGQMFALGHNTSADKQLPNDRQVGDHEPITDEAKKWVGWGTGLKPTVEPIVMARKPLIGTMAENVLEWGVGGLNIDASRIGYENEQVNFDAIQKGNIYGSGKIYGQAKQNEVTSLYKSAGRWPANVVFDEECAELLNEQSGITSSVASNRGDINIGHMAGYGDSDAGVVQRTSTIRGHNDSGGASRFFYVARASKSDRNEGLENLPAVMARNYAQDQTTLDTMPFGKLPKQNFHPTVKPTDLMRYLIKLVTPAGGVVLDPFTGSGSTGKAALLDGYQFLGIEMTDDYLPIIQGRLDWAEQQATQADKKENEKLF